MRLSRVRNLGRYRSLSTKKCVNMKTGRRTERGIDVAFYLRSGKRIFVSDFELWNGWVRVAENES